MPLPSCTRIPYSDTDGRDRLLAEGWREIEVLETWHGETPLAKVAIPLALALRPATLADGEKLADLAVAAFKFDRLHIDPMVDKNEANDAKRKWVYDALHDEDRRVTVAQLGASQYVGFLISKKISMNGKKHILIDLLAVSPKAQRMSIGRCLVLSIAQSSGTRLLRAGTQEVNEPAKAFYASLGMKRIKRQRTFHR